MAILPLLTFEVNLKQKAMKKLLFLFALISISLSLTAQQRVGTSIGLRFGSPTSLSAKHFITNEGAIEVMAGVRPYFTRSYSNSFLGAAYQHHMPLDLGDADFDALHWYVGAGGSFEFWNYNDDFFLGGARLRGDYSDVTIRASGYLGLQYALDEAPIEFTVDWSPSFVVGDTPFNRLRFGFYTLGVRYILK